jgi:inorganic pyrophosphatase/exopolyphosphatase
MKTIVTAGAQGADIDVFACAVAYSELLSLEGLESIPVIPGSFTSSVTPTILDWGALYETTYNPDGNENFVLVDISDPKHFATFVAHDRISEVYDHRSGHEEFWKAKLKDQSHIEMVGSCGTLIWEAFKRRGKANAISPTSAKLLLASIVSDNLALKSPLVTKRDRSAYEELSLKTGLSTDWISAYYLEQEKILLDEFHTYVQNDTKKIETSYGDFVIAQIELWDAKALLETKPEELINIMSIHEPTPWIVNIISVSEGFNYIYTTHAQAKEIIERALGVSFTGNVAITDSLLMRKYIMKVLQS